MYISKKNMKKITLIVALAIATVSCNSKKETATPQDQTATEQVAATNAALVGTVWKLTEVNNQAITLDKDFPKEPQLTFNPDHSVNGNLGCNGFGASYESKDNALTISQIASTQMACPNLEIEQKFIEVLTNSTSFEIKATTLLLKNEKGEVLATLKAE